MPTACLSQATATRPALFAGATLSVSSRLVSTGQPTRVSGHPPATNTTMPTARETSPGDLTIGWTRHSRVLAADNWGGINVPLGEELEAVFRGRHG